MLNDFTDTGESAVNRLFPSVHGNASDGGVAGFLNSFLEMLSGGFGSGSSWNPIAGIEALGSNVHPLFVHFPIAFLSAFLITEIAGLVFRTDWIRQVSSIMLYFGAIGAVLAAAAGVVAGNSVPHGAAVHEIMEWHERAGLTVAGLSVTLALWRAVAGARFSAMAQALHLLLGSITVACLFIGADLGGLMVYQYGVGVKSLQQADEHHHHHHD